MHILRSSALALLLSASSIAALSAAAHAQASISISVNIAPPPLPVYEQPPIPAEGYLWVPGYWSWDQSEDDFYWVPGTWVEAPQPDLLWTPGYWGWNDGAYVFYSGYWAPEVGFYGGIDYGYGYTGEGYAGGRWDHGAFFYNRAVNNIANVTISNVYNQTVVVNNNARNVSYNGGNGGATVRPTPQQMAAAKAQHVEATPLQRQHAEAASKNRALFLKQNHGEPAIAATPRPGVFEGAGVSRASHTAAGEKPAPATQMNGEQPKAGEEKKPAGATPMNKEPPKAGEEKKPEKPAPAAQLNKEPPKAEEEKKSEKPAPAAQMNKEPPKAEKPAPAATQTNKKPSKPEEEKKAD
jgi:hypothetical protein